MLRQNVRSLLAPIAWSIATTATTATTQSNVAPFVVMSYNILAQKLIKEQHSFDCDPTFLAIEHRLEVLKQQIAQSKPQILCLQEATSESAEQILGSPPSSSSTFAMHRLAPTDVFGRESPPPGFDPKTDSSLVTAWDTRRFSLVEVDEVNFNSHFQWTCSKDEAALRCLPSHNNALVTVLRDEMHKSKMIVVANVHFDYRRQLISAGRDDAKGSRLECLQQRQLDFLVSRIARRHGFDRTCPMCPDAEARLGCVIAGDFNVDGASAGARNTFWKPYLHQTADCDPGANPLGLEMADFSSSGDASLKNDTKIASTRVAAGPRWFDHILFSRGAFAVSQHTILPSRACFPAGLAEDVPSDHLPVGIRLLWKS